VFGESGERRPRRELAAVAGLGVILAVTAAWWALALWPLSGDAPAWVARARDVCFGTQGDGLPDAAGWIALIVQPALMLGTLLSVWGRSLADGLVRITGTPLGKAAVITTGSVLLMGAAASAFRVQSGLAGSQAATELAARPVWTEVERPAPALTLTDQRGARFSLESLQGQRVLVTFAFGHCEVICPLIVHNALMARRSSDRDFALVVVTLDPWRDTPARLPHIAGGWGLGPEDHLLSGSVDEVNRVLDEWEVPRSRNLNTGDIAHPPLAYLIDPTGTIAYRTNASASLPEPW